MEKHELTVEEQEDIKNLLSHEGFKPFLKLMENIIIGKSIDYVKVPLDKDNPNMEKLLLMERSKLEGGWYLYDQLKRSVNKLKREGKKVG